MAQLGVATHKKDQIRGQAEARDDPGNTCLQESFGFFTGPAEEFLGLLVCNTGALLCEGSYNGLGTENYA